MGSNWPSGALLPGACVELDVPPIVPLLVVADESPIRLTNTAVMATIAAPTKAATAVGSADQFRAAVVGGRFWLIASAFCPPALSLVTVTHDLLCFPLRNLGIGWAARV